MWTPLLLCNPADTANGARSPKAGKLSRCCSSIPPARTSKLASRTTTAFSSFHIRSPLDSTHVPYSCLTETYGAVQNQCAYEVDVMFDIPADTVYRHTFWAQNLVTGAGSTGATCAVWTYDGNGNGWQGTAATFNPSGPQTLQFTPARPGNNLSLLCTLPPGEGISSLTWLQ